MPKILVGDKVRKIAEQDAPLFTVRRFNFWDKSLMEFAEGFPEGAVHKMDEYVVVRPVRHTFQNGDKVVARPEWIGVYVQERGRFDGVVVDRVYEVCRAEEVNEIDNEGDGQLIWLKDTNITLFAFRMQPAPEAVVGLDDEDAGVVVRADLQPVGEAHVRPAKPFNVGDKLLWMNLPLTVYTVKAFRWGNDGWDMQIEYEVAGEVRTTWENPARVANFTLKEAEAENKAIIKPHIKREDLFKKEPKMNLKAMIAKARKEYRPKVAGVNYGEGVASYVVFPVVDGEIKEVENINDVCHARLECSRWYDEQGAGHDVQEIAAVLDFCHDYEHVLPEKDWAACKKYMNYIIQSSPWSIAFHKKGLKNVLANGILYDVSRPAGVVAGAAIALRQGKEHCHILPVFNKLHRKFGGAVAFLAGYAIGVNGNGEYMFNPIDGGHTPLSGQIKADVMFKFFANGFPAESLEKEPYSKNTHYRVFEAVGDDVYWGGVRGPRKGGQDFQEWVKENCPIVRKGNGFTAKTFITEEGLLQFADKLKAAIDGAKA